jgi:hypothetical protein
MLGTWLNNQHKKIKGIIWVGTARVRKTGGNRSGSTGSRWNRSGPVHEPVRFPPLNRAYNFYLLVNQPFDRFTDRYFWTVGTGPPTVRLTLGTTVLCWAIWRCWQDVIFEKLKTNSIMQVIFRGAYWATLLGPVTVWRPSQGHPHSDEQEIRDYCFRDLK